MCNERQLSKLSRTPIKFGQPSITDHSLASGSAEQLTSWPADQLSSSTLVQLVSRVVSWGRGGRLWNNSTFCAQFEVQNKKYSSPLLSFGQLMAFLQFLHMFCMRNLPFPQSNNTQHRQQQQVRQQHRRYVRAGSWAFSKAKFLAFLQNVLANFISSKAEVEAEEKKSRSRTQRKSVAYIAAHARRVGKKQQQQQQWQCNLATSQSRATWQHGQTASTWSQNL